jgi:hypothetical protein
MAPDVQRREGSKVNIALILTTYSGQAHPLVHKQYHPVRQEHRRTTIDSSCDQLYCLPPDLEDSNIKRPSTKLLKFLSSFFKTLFLFITFTLYRFNIYFEFFIPLLNFT